MEPTEIVLYVPDCPYCARHREICEDAEQRLEYSLTDEELELFEAWSNRDY
jgi:glutaredoxin